jgi:ribosome-interacting GTPase 1
VLFTRVYKEGNTMGLICGLVGLPSSGKTVIFNAITAAGFSYNGSEKSGLYRRTGPAYE